MTKQQIATLTIPLLAGYVVFCAFGYLLGRSATPAPIPIAMTVRRPTSTPGPTIMSYGRVISFAKPIAPFVVTESNYPAEAEVYLSGVDDAIREAYFICQDVDTLLADDQLSIAEFRDKKIELSVQVGMVIMETLDELAPPPELHGMHQNVREAMQWIDSSITNHPAPDEYYMFDESYISLSGKPMDSARQLAEAVRLLELAWQERELYLEAH